ncbi:MAG: kinase inhibitor [Candidatus Levybacteria bacterium RIFCSPHIGHO2_01_FULL_37_17]|nr:MAG: kinase inhibitor [Candidatus Levybacteria bacterium RIFCSPHIGHO2_01_FULL_37_17]OGH37050.1 MAG: kinase inhibitor [Candidatus Levybacteria bacterium RIFCSPLOWO2_01_FULL_38_23]
MKITSSAFEDNQKIPDKYTCDGENINPSLEFENIPDNAKSLSLIMEDPDVPKDLRADGMFDHWVVFNIPPEIISIEENSEPLGIVGQNTRGDSKYTGPCPPDRKHRYFFKLFALDVILDLDSSATKKDVEKAMAGHMLDKAELMGIYER